MGGDPLRPHRDNEGNVIGIYAVHTDIHDQKKNEDALPRELDALVAHRQHAARGSRMGPRADAALVAAGRSHLRLERKKCSACRLSSNPLLHENGSEEMKGLVNRAVRPRARETALTSNYRKDGNTISCEWYHSALLGEDGKVVSILSFVQDVSSRIQAEERLQYMATRDALTGLPNRLMPTSG